MTRMFADLLLMLGGLALFLGALGLLRMPDLYTRLQAAAKAVTLGALALLVGLALHRPEWAPKLLLAGLFLLLASPAGASAVARAARLGGVPLWRAPADRGDDGEKRQ